MPVTFSTRDAMRKIGVLALAGFALVGFLAAWASNATAQVAPGGDISGAALGRAAIPVSPCGDMPLPPLRLVGVPGRVTGAGEASEATASVTAVALQTLAEAKWMITRHIGLFFDYKFRSEDALFRILNATADMKLNINHIFGGVALHF